MKNVNDATKSFKLFTPALAGVDSFMAFFGKIAIFAETGGVIMATYTIRVNERTKAGRGLISYLRALGVIEEPNDETMKAIAEIESGKGTRCESFEEYLEAVR